MTPDSSNRRESFRIDTTIPTSVCKAPGGIPPEAKLVPVSLTGTTTSWAAELIASGEEINTSFALLLIEINTKLDLLLGDAPKGRPTGKRLPKVSLGQLLYQASAKTDRLLTRHRIQRPEDAIRVSEVSLSASGIKLHTMSNVSVGDTIEVRMLLNPGQPVWVLVGGTVIRVAVEPEGEREVAVNFLPMPDPVRDVITTYALKRQREVLRAERSEEL